MKHMKHCFLPFLVISVVILSSLSECVYLYEEDNSPISLEINGVRYYSPSDRFDKAEFNGKGFDLLRELHSEEDENDRVMLSLKMEADTILLNRKYTELKPALSVLGGESVKNAWIEFADCYKIGYLKKIVVKFEFDIFNESTGNVLYEIRQGEFDVIYTYPD